MRLYLTQTTRTALRERSRQHDALASRLARQSPAARLRNDRQRLDDLARRLGLAAHHGMRLHASRMDTARARLEGLNPLSVLARGFAIVTGAHGRVIRSAREVAPGDALTLRVQDGSFGATVSE
jgi:exodeoxyribonuclease VII large subunit